MKNVRNVEMYFVVLTSTRLSSWFLLLTSYHMLATKNGNAHFLVSSQSQLHDSTAFQKLNQNENQSFNPDLLFTVRLHSVLELKAVAILSFLLI